MLVHKWLLAVAVVALATVPLGASASAQATGRAAVAARPAHDGHIHGRLLQVGGPPAPDGNTARQPVSGFVHVKRNGHLVKRVTIPKNGVFHLSLRPATYRITGTCTTTRRALRAWLRTPSRFARVAPLTPRSSAQCPSALESGNGKASRGAVTEVLEPVFSRTVPTDCRQTRLAHRRSAPSP